MISIPSNWSGFSRNDLDRMPLADLQLPVRVQKRLDYEGIRTIGELVRKSAGDLLAIYGFGKTGLRYVRKALAEHGLSLRGDA